MINLALAVVAADSERVGGFRLGFQDFLTRTCYFKQRCRDMVFDAQEAVGETNTIFLGAIGPTGVAQ